MQQPDNSIFERNRFIDGYDKKNIYTQPSATNVLLFYLINEILVKECSCLILSATNRQVSAFSCFCAKYMVTM